MILSLNSSTLSLVLRVLLALNCAQGIIGSLKVEEEGEIVIPPYTRYSVLQKDNYIVEWSIDSNKSSIQFIVTVRTKGFIGFGISQSQGMNQADLIIGGVFPNGSIYFTDRYGIESLEPKVDESQDWVLIEGWESKTHTILHFSRLLETLDKDEDIPIKDETLNIIWSYGQTDNISYHGGTNRGSLPVNLLALENY